MIWMDIGIMIPEDGSIILAVLSNSDTPITIKNFKKLEIAFKK